MNIGCKQKHQIGSATTKTLKINDEYLSRKLKAERERIQLQQQRKRKVYDAICLLSDPVDESEFLKHLPILDLSAWAEVIEERFLGRLCGYPVCSNSIQVDFRRKFTILKRPGQPKQYVPVDAEPNKFCSLRCMCMARAVAGQLDTEEMHLSRLTTLMTSTMEQPKQFNLPNGEEWRVFLQSNNQNEENNIPDGIDLDEETSPTMTKPELYAQAELVKRLHELKVADNEDEDSDNDADESRELSDYEEKQFLNFIKRRSH